MASSDSKIPDFSQLASRLRMIHDPKENVTVDTDHIMKMSLSELSDCVVTFGKTHVGKTYQELTKLPQYLTWFAATYKDSKKSEHIKLLRFIQLHVEDMEADQKKKGYPKATKTPTKSTKGQPSPKPKTAPSKVEAPESDFSEEPWDEVNYEMPPTMPQDMMALQNRMAEVEVATQQILLHLSQQAGQAPPQ